MHGIITLSKLILILFLGCLSSLKAGELSTSSDLGSKANVDSIGFESKTTRSGVGNFQVVEFAVESTSEVHGKLLQHDLDFTLKNSPADIQFKVIQLLNQRDTLYYMQTCRRHYGIARQTGGFLLMQLMVPINSTTSTTQIATLALGPLYKHFNATGVTYFVYAMVGKISGNISQEIFLTRALNFARTLDKAGVGMANWVHTSALNGVCGFDKDRVTLNFLTRREEEDKNADAIEKRNQAVARGYGLSSGITDRRAWLETRGTMSAQTLINNAARHENIDFDFGEGKGLAYLTDRMVKFNDQDAKERWSRRMEQLQYNSSKYESGAIIDDNDTTLIPIGMVGRTPNIFIPFNLTVFTQHTVPQPQPLWEQIMQENIRKAVKSAKLGDTDSLELKIRIVGKNKPSLHAIYVLSKLFPFFNSPFFNSKNRLDASSGTPPPS
jgi:hypothetical protein